MKLWLLDADILIDFLSHDVLNKLSKIHEIYAASTVIDEVKYFKRDGKQYPVSFRDEYIKSGLIKEISATPEDAATLFAKLPPKFRLILHPGEIESLAVLMREDSLIFCTCDAATIRTLPSLDLTDRGISAEELLKKSGLLKPGLQDRHTEAYFKDNIAIGKEQKIYQF